MIKVSAMDILIGGKLVKRYRSFAMKLVADYCTFQQNRALGRNYTAHSS
jgi:hypothetical protein